MWGRSHRWLPSCVILNVCLCFRLLSLQQQVNNILTFCENKSAFMWTLRQWVWKYPSSYPLPGTHWMFRGQLQDLWVLLPGSLRCPNESMPGWSCQLSFTHMHNLSSKKSSSSLLFMAFDLLPSIKTISIISSSLTQWTLKSSCIHLFLPYHGFSDVKDVWPSPFEECRNVLCHSLQSLSILHHPKQMIPTGTGAISCKPFRYARHQMESQTRAVFETTPTVMRGFKVLCDRSTHLWNLYCNNSS